MTDSLPPEAPLLDPTRRMAIIDPTDPLLAEFAYQHDLRERFLVAISDSIIELNAAVALPAKEAVLYRHAQIALDKLSKAVDPTAIDAWIAEGRPLPSIDGAMAERGNQLDKLLQDVMGG